MSKYASTILLIILIISGLASVFTIHFGSAQTSTPVNGIITQDTTWTKTNSPYSLTGNILVNDSASLTIEAGTTINLNHYYIRVNGSLIIQPDATLNMELISDGIQVNGVLSAKGTNAKPIRINGSIQPHGFSGPGYSAISFSSSSIGWSQQTNEGSIIENAILTSTRLELSSGVKISNSVLNGGLIISGGSCAISNSDISSQTLAVWVIGGTPVIVNNKILGGVQIESGYSIIRDNIIAGLTFSGIYESMSVPACSLYDRGSPLETIFERNLITNSSVGITCGLQNLVNHVTIENNTIFNNTVGIQIQTANVPAIINNNIYGNTMNVKLSSKAISEVNLTYNWWGTIDEQKINQTIYDFKNDFNLGRVNFVPFLLFSNSEAKPDPNAPMPTPEVPEFPVSVILIVILISVLTETLLKMKHYKIGSGRHIKLTKKTENIELKAFKSTGDLSKNGKNKSFRTWLSFPALISIQRFLFSGRRSHPSSP